jgi:hypothetical protein
MRLLLIFFFFCLFLTCTTAQSNYIRQLDHEFSTAKGEVYVAKALQLSQAFFDEGFWIDAEQKADNALTTAKQLTLTEQTGIAMHHKAQAMIEVELRTNKPKFFLGAKDLLENSLKILQQSGSTNEIVLKSDLTYLKLVLEKRGKKKDVIAIQQQLDLLNTKEQNRLIQAEKQDLQQNVSNLNEKTHALSQKTEALNQKTQQLSGDLQQKQQVIGSLSEAQAKSAL